MGWVLFCQLSPLFSVLYTGMPDCAHLSQEWLLIRPKSCIVFQTGAFHVAGEGMPDMGGAGGMPDMGGDDSSGAGPKIEEVD